MLRRMRTRNVAVITLACLLTGAGLAAAETVDWETDVEAAFAKAKAEDRPLLLHFWTPTCVPCRQLEQTVFNQQPVIDSMHNHFVPVKINAHEHPDLATRYGIRSVPKDVIVTSDNQEVHRMFTPKDPEQYIAQLSAIAFQVANRAGERDTRFASRDLPYGDGPAAFDRDEAMQPDPTRMARRSPLSPPAGVQTETRFASSTAPTDEEGPREIINRFAGKSSKPSSDSDLDRGDEPANRTGSRWGSWPNSDVATNAEDDFAAGDPVAAATDAVSQAAQRSADQFAVATNRADRPNASSAASPSVRDNRPPAAKRPSEAPSLGMDGYCPVTLLKENRWVRGDKRYGVIHRGRTYLFAGPQEKETFFADPDEYSPVLAGIDPVALNEQGQAIEGKRVHGVVYHRRVYLFSSEDNLNRFWEAPEQFASPIRQAMEAGDLNQLFR